MERQIQRDLFYIATSLLADLDREEARYHANTTARKLIQLESQGYTLTDFAAAVIHAAKTVEDPESGPDRAP